MITRRDFIGVCGALGLPLGGTSCVNNQRKRSPKFDGSVIVVGAGAAGMSAGYLLAQQGISFSILEAGPTYGGRIKTNYDFVDFPIPLGGEWIHTTPDILSQIVNDDSVDVTTNLVSYDPKAIVGSYKSATLETGLLGRYQDLKFVDGTWLTFFEQHILPTIEKRMRFRTEVSQIDYSGETVAVKDRNGKTHSGDAVIITVPPQVIKDHRIAFVPPLPKWKQNAFDDAYIWSGMKVFIEFKERFYPTFLEIEGTNSNRGQKVFYDAAYGQKSARNVLGLFAVGDQAKVYQARQDTELRDFILDELDQIFDGAPSRLYLDHIAQDWSQEPFIRQAYFADSGDWRLPPQMQRTVDRRVFFAGDTYSSGDDWGSVHVAASSAREAFDALTSQT